MGYVIYTHAESDSVGIELNTNYDNPENIIFHQTDLIDRVPTLFVAIEIARNYANKHGLEFNEQECRKRFE